MNNSNRRQFLASACAATATLAAANFRTGNRPLRSRKSDVIVGEGEYQYRVDHNFLELPKPYHWQTTHNVAVDSENNLYVIHEGQRSLKDHPAIFVFGPDGKFNRAFGSQFQGGGHGIEIRKEGNQEFLYVAAYQQVKAFAKLTLSGETVWYQKAPMESGVYAANEHLSTEPSWNRRGFLPTNFAFLDDGGFLLADGYGSYFIHQFDRHGKWVRCFGGSGEADGQFNTSHGLWVDRRKGRTESIVVTDRARNRLQILALSGEHIETLDGFGLPANIDTFDNLMVVPELKARVTLLNEQNEVVARLGEAVSRLDEIKDLRAKPDQWKAGQFVHPHDACFDKNGDIFVAEWVQSGRVTKLTREK